MQQLDVPVHIAQRQFLQFPDGRVALRDQSIQIGGQRLRLTRHRRFPGRDHATRHAGQRERRLPGKRQGVVVRAEHNALAHCHILRAKPVLSTERVNH
ncbi:hypothetical protein LV28_13215 [Pandoraea pnomenusa]|uniref:Uncharacterized protein n=1 Tax=Pandoraea pnomenusa TaxID=93220 RepID=A0A378YMQ5_9BURK|nr:hypothetical protein [Pandoraea pnomenusa]AIU27361.1 hypothetical protein LV28_13215 [Pandoraea pnomenusa]SUA78462.1 Uncharacterised protein [Pandoraea pnomenusa]